jgi:hypothetical protein
MSQPVLVSTLTPTVFVGSIATVTIWPEVWYVLLIGTVICIAIVIQSTIGLRFGESSLKKERLASRRQVLMRK